MKYKMSSNNSNPDVDKPMNLVWDYSDISIMETFFVFTSSKICSICEGPFFKDKITTPDCNHWMHQVCYMEFCKTNSHCATCKRFFNQMYYTNHSLFPSTQDCYRVKLTLLTILLELNIVSYYRITKQIQTLQYLFWLLIKLQSKF